MFKGQPDGQHVPTPNQYNQETEQNVVKIQSNIDYEASGNDQILHVNTLDSNISRGLAADSIPSANGDGKVYGSLGYFSNLFFLLIVKSFDLSH